MQYWYNVDTGQVQTDETRSRGAQVLGPYPTEQAARQALETARARTEQWDEQDREWERRNAATGRDEDLGDD